MNELQYAAEARIRLEYDPDEVDEIEDRLPMMVYQAWGDAYERLAPDARLDKFMRLVRRTFGPSRTRRPAPEAAPDPASTPEPRPGRLAPPMDLPSWDTS